MRRTKQLFFANGCVSHFKGKTYQEIYGKNAKAEIEKRKKTQIETKNKKYNKKYSGSFVKKVIKLYTVDKFSTLKIGKKLKYSSGTIWWILCKNNVPIRTFKEAAQFNKFWLGKKFSKEAKDNMSKAHIGLQAGEKSPTWGKKRSKTTRDKISKTLTGWFKNGISIKARRKRSKLSKKLWQTPEYVRKQMATRRVLPNKPEKLLDKILQSLFFGEYKYVGDGQFILAGKCPDFVNVNGQKKIIELFGDWFHSKECAEQRGRNYITPQARINIFKEYGYETLIVWERELKNTEVLKESLLKFNGQQN